MVLVGVNEESVGIVLQSLSHVGLHSKCYLWYLPLEVDFPSLYIDLR